MLQKGHLSRVCSYALSNTQHSNNYVTYSHTNLVVPSSPSSLTSNCFIKISVLKAEALIDTGSSNSFISTTFATQSKVKILLYKGKILWFLYFWFLNLNVAVFFFTLQFIATSLRLSNNISLNKMSLTAMWWKNIQRHSPKNT